MAQPVIQTAFHSGEWAPALNARVDVAKYHSACALALNYYVDYRGGVSTRMGTKYILQAYRSSTAVRLIPFQASTVVGYVLEFGDQYIRFYFNGAAVLETAQSITAITQANPGQVTKNAHGYSNGEWLFLTSMVGMTQLNNRYVQVAGVMANTFTLQDLNGVAINTTAFGAFVSGNMARVYTLPSPYAAADLALLKYAQNVTDLYICHPSYAPRILRLIAANNWTLTTITFGSQVAAPTGIAVATTLAAGTVNYSYTVTAVDANGQESVAGTAAALANRQDLRTVAGTNRVTWNAVTGAVRYNIYKAELSYTNAVASGAAHGYIGFSATNVFDDSNIAPDFIEAPPIAKNPFQGSGVESITVTNVGAYTTVPGVTIANAPAGGVTATGQAVLQVQSMTSAGVGTTNWLVGDIAYAFNTATSTYLGVAGVVATLAGGRIATFQPMTFPGSIRGSVSSGAVASNPVQYGASPTFGVGGKAESGNLTWGVGIVNVLNPGSGYLTAPAVTFSAGAATATAILADVLGGNPFVPQFAWQRLGLLGQTASPQQFDFSQPGRYTNFDVSDPSQPDDAISGTLVSGVLNEIKSALAMPSGLIIFSDRAAWLLYGTQQGQAATAIDITAQPQAYVGASDVPPIIANDNILYVQANGASVRNLNYNFYSNVYTGTDISILSSHLFYNKEILEWCWAEEPFKVAWAIRDDGIMLSLTFVKEQELIGWAHSNTDGLWKSCATVVEQLATMRVNAVYLVAERVINGNTVKYIERMADRTFTNFTNCWCVDAGLQYSGAPTASFSGAEHLIGETVRGLADGTVFQSVVQADGTFTIAVAASLVTAGLQFVADFQTLAIDTGNPTIQGKEKKIPSVVLRVQDTLALQIGSAFDVNLLIDIDDLTIGNIGTMTNLPVTGLVTGDVQATPDPDWTVEGQYCIRQNFPYPATILGVIPELTVGDTEK